MAGSVVYSIDFAAQVSRLVEGTQKGATAVREMATRMESATNLARNALTALAGALGAYSFTEWIKGASEAADQAAKMSDRFGIATESIVGLNLAAKLGGADQDAVSTALRTMAYQAVQAGQGLEQSRRAFEMLHINVDQFLQLPVAQQFDTLIQRLHDTDNATVRTAAAQQLLGRGAGELGGLIAEGSSAIADATSRTEAWGLALSRVDAAKLEMANDALTEARAAAQGIATTIAVQLAPFVRLVADRFADATAEAKGFKAEATSGMETVSGAVADGAWFIERLEFAWEGLKTAAATAIDGVIETLATLDRAWTDAQNKALLKSDVGSIHLKQYNATLQEIAAVSHNRLGEIQSEFDKFTSGTLTLDQWQAKVEDLFKKAREEMQKGAAGIAADRAKYNKEGGGTPDLGLGQKQLDDWVKAQEDAINTSDAAWAAYAASQKSLADSAQSIIESTMTNPEKLAEQLHNQEVIIQNAADQGLVGAEAAHRAIEQLELEHQAKMGDIVAQGELQRQKFREMSSRQQVQSVLGSLVQMTQGVATTNKQMFELNKAASIGLAIVNTAAGVTQALKHYPPPLSLVMAAIQAAAGAAQIAAIQSTHFGGTSSAPSIGGGGATPVFQAPVSGQPAAQQQQEQTTIVHYHGSDKSEEETIRNFAAALNEASRNGTVVLVQ